MHLLRTGYPGVVTGSGPSMHGEPKPGGMRWCGQRAGGGACQASGERGGGGTHTVRRARALQTKGVTVMRRASYTRKT
eukprot:1082551-Prymnesium_polylepis.1